MYSKSSEKEQKPETVLQSLNQSKDKQVHKLTNKDLNTIFFVEVVIFLINLNWKNI